MRRTPKRATSHPTTKRKTTNSADSEESPRHPSGREKHPIWSTFSPPMTMRKVFVCAVALLMVSAVALAQSGKPHPNDCILYGNVFTADGHLFEGADVHVRHATDKKPKWDAMSDRRGEFAVRVPPQGDYVVEVRAKGFVTQSRTVTSQSATRLNLVFHMVEQTGKH
jgi:hypothetical protein